MMITKFILSMALLLAFFIIGNVYCKKKLNKDSTGDMILKKIKTGIENCVKNQTKIDKGNITPHFTKCITAIQNKKSLLKDKKKITKDFLKKVLKGILNCLKSKMTKNSNKLKGKKKPRSKNKREKRSKRPSNTDEEMNQALEKVSKCSDEVTDGGKSGAIPIPAEKCECGRAESNQRVDALTNARIFKGKEVIQKQYPWQMLIHMKFKNIAGEMGYKEVGGTLISRKHVLTAAHNFYHLEDRTKYISSSTYLKSR